MYVIANLDNCCVSCERVFRPDLIGKPVAVLSNNDGCVVARSNEAKAMGINAEQFEKMKRLDEVIDRINRMQGSETIVLGSQQYTRKDGKGKADVFANAIKHDYRSPNPTTRWSDVIKLK